MNLNDRRAPDKLPSTLAGFCDRHAGETIVVCGCGNSLAAFDAHERFTTVGVNDVGRMFDPDYLVVLNGRHQFARDRFRYVENSRARAIFTQLRLVIPHKHIVTFRLGRRGGTEVDDDETLPYTRNSPYVAVALAMYMGARRIGLTGVDFTEDHFFARTGRHPLTRELPQIDAEYTRLYEACRQRGVEVFNLSEVSRLTAFPKMPLAEFERVARPRAPLRIVSYATTPVAGVPPILARSIAAKTSHECRAVWATDGYGNGVRFTGDIEYTRAAASAAEMLDAADVVVVHNGKVAPPHVRIIEEKAVVTLAHNYMWNVDTRWVTKGFPGLVVAQYQATLPEFAGWTAVPNPLPFWERAFSPEPKEAPIAIAYTPSSKSERYPDGHRLYWHSKGYATTIAALERLAARMPLRLEVVRQHQIAHAEALAAKRGAHIVIDECVTGSYHRNSLEGLAAGCVVINGIGILPGVAEVFRDVAECDDIPFVAALLEELEGVLVRLLERGPDELARDGARNRAWMERHWSFERQWTRFWEPAVERALDRAGRARAKERAPAIVQRPEPAVAADATVVVPFGGAERLRNLELALRFLRESDVTLDILVAEMDQVPRAGELAAAMDCRHLFVPQESTFHKARVMNAAIPFVQTSLFFWLDGDLLVSRCFIRTALAEMQERKLDCLVPWTTVRYLDAEESAAVAVGTRTPIECTPVNVYSTRTVARGGVVLVRTEFVRTYGGICEEFHGWGGEDNAWFLKSALLGRAAPTRRRDQHLYHAYHPRSGGYGPPAAIAANPNYSRNLALLQEIRRLRTRESFLRRFPPPPSFTPPWHGVKKVACARGAEAIRDALVQLYGPAVELCDTQDSADAVIAPEGAVHPHAAALRIATRLAFPQSLS